MDLSLSDIQRDWRVLDAIDLRDDLGPPVAFASNVPWDCRTPWGEAIRHIGPSPRLAAASRFLRRCRLSPLAILASLLDTFLRAFRLWRASRVERSVILLNLGDSSAFAFGLLRRIWPTRGKAVASHIYLHRWSWPKRTLLRWALGSVSACAVWSRRQVEAAEQLLGTRGPEFLKLPYKANHSQHPREPALPMGGYVFSGGNTERDYRTLFAALGGLPIPVMVSCTDPAALRGLDIPANVVVVAAREPHFRRLMAGARIVVLCLKPGLLRGAGEATFLNAMWHGRPVVVADDGSAAEYIDDGETGFVVAAEDAEAVRQRVLSLWDDEELRERIGEAGRRLAESDYTGERWRGRMLRLALAVINPARVLSVSFVRKRARAAMSSALKQSRGGGYGTW